MINVWEPLWTDDVDKETGQVTLSAAKKRGQLYKQIPDLVLEDLKRSLGFYSSTFDRNPYVMAFNEGQRAVLIAITNTRDAVDRPETPTPAPPSYMTEEPTDYDA